MQSQPHARVAERKFLAWIISASVFQPTVHQIRRLIYDQNQRERFSGTISTGTKKQESNELAFKIPEKKILKKVLCTQTTWDELRRQKEFDDAECLNGRAMKQLDDDNIFVYSTYSHQSLS